LRISVWKPVCVSCCKYACFRAYFCKSCLLCGAYSWYRRLLHWSITIRLITHCHWNWIIWVLIGVCIGYSLLNLDLSWSLQYSN
jgi:hypothetical protein